MIFSALKVVPNPKPTEWDLDMIISPAVYFWVIVAGCVTVFAVVLAIIFFLHRQEKKAEEPEGPNGCIICLQATWDVIYVSNNVNILF